uniref:Uncharacterized protein n=1 Tax=Timema bartmani TaxID=61472 RepID=A0A7R9F4M6_9NEOP|nr:unnamed protein product [Timema bartmani]
MVVDRTSPKSVRLTAMDSSGQIKVFLVTYGGGNCPNHLAHSRAIVCSTLVEVIASKIGQGAELLTKILLKNCIPIASTVLVSLASNALYYCCILWPHLLWTLLTLRETMCQPLLTPVPHLSWTLLTLRETMCQPLLTPVPHLSWTLLTLRETMCQPLLTPVPIVGVRGTTCQGLYEEGIQDVVTQVFIQGSNSTPWLIRLHDCTSEETSSPCPPADAITLIAMTLTCSQQA